jgi:hypothetical protein
MWVQWGTFYLNTPYSNALQYIGDLMTTDRESPYDLNDPPDPSEDYQIVGISRAHDLITTVVCVPVAAHSTWVSLVCSGPDGQVAELERNSLRQKIIDLDLN